MATQIEKQTAPGSRPLQKMLAAFPQAREKHNGYYEHSDNPRFDFREREDGSISIHSWTGRTEDEILAMGGLKRSDISLKGQTYPGPTKDSLDILDLAIAKCIPPHFLENLGLQSGYVYHGRRYVKIPYFNADGTQHTKIKVRCKIEGKGKHYWDENTPGEFIPYGMHKYHMAIEAGYALKGEGETDGWACWYNGIPYLGIPGADMQKTLKHLDMNMLPPKIYILLESDQKQKMLDNGQGFYKNVHRELRKNGYTGEIFCIDFKKITGHKDPSDLHIALWKEGKTDHFKEIIHQAMEQAIPANDETEDQAASIVDKAIEGKDLEALLSSKSIAILAQLTRAEYTLYKDKIKGAFGKRINLSDLNSSVSEVRKLLEQTDEKPSLDIIADDFADKHKEDWAFNALSSAWYQWTGTHWQNMQDSESQKKSCVTLDRIVRDLMRARDLGINKSSDLDCVVRLAAIHCKRSFVPTPGVVNFRNGTLEVSTGTLRAHDRDDQLTYCLPYDYEVHGQWPAICKFLQELFPDKYARQNFMVHIGLSLMGDTKMHYADAIIGPPRVGKSTALDLANITCGINEKEYAGKTLFNPDLEGKRTRYMQNKKRIVCIDELPVAALRNEETVKNMMAHSGVEMRGMLKDEELDNKWRPKIFMAMNEKPEYKDTSGALKERIVPLMVGSTRPKDQRDLQLIDKMKPELGGFAASCIRLAQAALKRGYYPFSGAMKAVMNEMEAASNPLKSFIQEECALDPEGFIFTDELYELYKSFCSRANNIPLAKYKMSNELTQMGKGITQKRKRNEFKNNEVQRGLVGIRLRTGGDPELEDSLEDDDPMLVVDDVDDMLTTLFKRRQQAEAASEAVSDTLVDDVNDVFEKDACREPIEESNEQMEKDAQSNLPSKDNDVSNKEYFGEMSFTSSTNGMKPHVERAEPVDDNEKTSSTCRQRRQQKPEMPKWLIPGTFEWDRLVDRVGVKEANERRQAALRAQS